MQQERMHIIVNHVLGSRLPFSIQCKATLGSDIWGLPSHYWCGTGLILDDSNLYSGAVNQVGAGTMNPATFLRVIGPEEWKTCYIEPSVRPDDSRYGENPNRLQQHTQLQVTGCSIPLPVRHGISFAGNILQNYALHKVPQC